MSCAGYILQFLYQKETQDAKKRVQTTEGMKETKHPPSHGPSCFTSSVGTHQEANP